MARFKLDKSGKIVVQSDGLAAIESAEKKVDPRVYEITGENERLRLAALNQPSHNAKTVREILAENDDVLDNNQRELRDLSPDGFDSDDAQGTLDKMVDFLRRKSSLQSFALEAVQNNPTLLSDVKDTIFKKSLSALDTATRVLNFPVAVESGAIRGLVKSLKGEGTVLDGINESIRANGGFSDVLEELGLPEGTRRQLKLPNIAPLAPSYVAHKMVQNVREGRAPVEIRPFGPVVTDRGIMGFALDVVLDPTTYLSFGTNTPAKFAARVGAKSVLSKGANELGAKSIVRFADKTLLTDKELLRGISTLKSTKAGHAVLETIDRFAATQLGQGLMANTKALADSFGKSFLPDYGIHKETAAELEKATRLTHQLQEEGAKIVNEAFASLDEKEAIEFGKEIFEKNRSESLFRRLKTRSSERIARTDDVAKIAGFTDGTEAFSAIRNLPERLRKSPLLVLARNENIRKKLTPDVLDYVHGKGAINKGLLTKAFTPRELDLLNRYKSSVRTLGNARQFERLIIDKLSKLPKRTFEKLAKIKFDPTQSIGLQPFSNPKFQKVADTVVGKNGLVTRLAKFAGLPEEILYENYIPGILEEHIKKIAGGSVSKYRKQLLSTGRFRKEFKIKPTDPQNAYTIRMGELVKVGVTRRAIRRIIKKFGVDEAGYKKALQRGYDEFFPRDVVKQFGITKSFDREGFLGVVDAQKPVFLPRQVLDTIATLAERQSVNSGAFIGMLDKLTHTWKSYVTTVWPSFHFRNAMSNQVLRFLNEGWKAFKIDTNLEALQMMIDSPKLKDTVVELGKKSGKTIPLSIVKQWAKADGITDSSQFLIDLGGKYLDNLTDREIQSKLVNLITPNVAKNDLIKIGREIGNSVEAHAKLTSYTQALKDGFSRKEAADIAFQGLFDYGHLTSFEKKVMRRIFPFYTFARKNFGLELKSTLTNPGRQATVFKLIKDLRDEALNGLTEEQLEAFNEAKSNILKSSFAIPVGVNPNGEVMWFTGLGLPQENIIDLMSTQGVFFQTNPAIKLGHNELMRQFDEAGVISFKESYTLNELKFLFNDVFTTTSSREKLLEWVNDPNGLAQHSLGKLMGLKAIKRDVLKDGRPTGEEDYSFTADPRALDLLRNTFLARAMSQFRAFSDPNADDTQDFVRFITGWTIYAQNIERAQRAEVNATKAEIGENLKRNGLGYVYSRPVVNKEGDFDLKRFVKELSED